MAGRDWDSHHSLTLTAIAVAVSLLVIGFAVAVVLGQWAKVHEGYAQYQSNAAKEREDAAIKTAERCKGRDGDSLSVCVAEQLTAYHRQNETNQDLQAQKDMAFWAMIASTISGISALTSAGGIWLLWLTLSATRSALDSARSQASAAIKQTAMLGQQMRSWVKIDEARALEPPSRGHGGNVILLPMKISLCNVGNSIATNATVAFVPVLRRGAHDGLMDYFRDIMAREEWSYVTPSIIITPGQTDSVVNIVEIAVEPEDTTTTCELFLLIVTRYNTIGTDKSVTSGRVAYCAGFDIDPDSETRTKQMPRFLRADYLPQWMK